MEEIRGIVSQDHVTRGTWKLDANGNDASGRGLTAEPTGTPEWTGGQTSNPDPTDLALRLNGTGAHLSAPHAVDTNKSFAVAAWAKLDKIGGNPSVVSQDGNRTSAFQLQATTEGRWAFAMFGADVDGGGSVHDRVLGGAGADRGLDSPGRRVRRGGQAALDLRQRREDRFRARTPTPGTTPPAACRSAGPSGTASRRRLLPRRDRRRVGVQPGAVRERDQDPGRPRPEPRAQLAARRVQRHQRGRRDRYPERHAHRRRGVRAGPGRQRGPARRRRRRRLHQRRGHLAPTRASPWRPGST